MTEAMPLLLAVLLGSTGYLASRPWLRWANASSQGGPVPAPWAFAITGFLTGIVLGLPGYGGDFGIIWLGAAGLILGICALYSLLVASLRGWRHLRRSNIGRAGEADLVGATVFFLFALACVAGVVLAVVDRVTGSQPTMDALNRAPTCVSPSEANCVLNQRATIVARYSVRRSSALLLSVPGHEEQVICASNCQPAGSAPLGAVVVTQTWRGHIVRVQLPGGTIDTQESPQNALTADLGVGVAAGVGAFLFALGGLVALLYGWVKVRAARTLRQADPNADISGWLVRPIGLSKYSPPDPMPSDLAAALQAAREQPTDAD